MVKEKSDNYNSGVASQTRKPLIVMKIGGNIIDDEEKLSSFLKDFASLNSPLQEIGAEPLQRMGAKKY